MKIVLLAPAIAPTRDENRLPLELHDHVILTEGSDDDNCGKAGDNVIRDLIKFRLLRATLECKTLHRHKS